MAKKTTAQAESAELQQNGADEIKDLQHGEDEVQTKEEPLDEHRKRALEIFAKYPNQQEVHFTTDGLAFLSRCDAQNHAISLKDGGLTTIKRN